MLKNAVVRKQTYYKVENNREACRTNTLLIALENKKEVSSTSIKFSNVPEVVLVLNRVQVLISTLQANAQGRAPRRCVLEGSAIENRPYTWYAE